MNKYKSIDKNMVFDNAHSNDKIKNAVFSTLMNKLFYTTDYASVLTLHILSETILSFSFLIKHLENENFISMLFKKFIFYKNMKFIYKQEESDEWIKNDTVCYLMVFAMKMSDKMTKMVFLEIEKNLRTGDHKVILSITDFLCKIIKKLNFKVEKNANSLSEDDYHMNNIVFFPFKNRMWDFVDLILETINRLDKKVKYFNFIIHSFIKYFFFLLQRSVKKELVDMSIEEILDGSRERWGQGPPPKYYKESSSDMDDESRIIGKRMKNKYKTYSEINEKIYKMKSYIRFNKYIKRWENHKIYFKCSYVSTQEKGDLKVNNENLRRESKVCTFQEDCTCSECTKISENGIVGDYYGEYPQLDVEELNRLSKDQLTESAISFYEDRWMNSSGYEPINANFFDSLNELARKIFEQREVEYRESFYTTDEYSETEKESNVKEEEKLSNSEKEICGLLDVLYYEDILNIKEFYKFVDKICEVKKLRKIFLNTIVYILNVSEVQVKKNVIDLYDFMSESEYENVVRISKCIMYLDANFLLSRSLEILNNILPLHEDYTLFFKDKNNLFNFILMGGNRDLDGFIKLLFNLRNLFVNKRIEFELLFNIIDLEMNPETFYYINEFIECTCEYNLKDCYEFFKKKIISYLDNCYVLLENQSLDINDYSKKIFKCLNCLFKISSSKEKVKDAEEFYYNCIKKIQDHIFWNKFFEFSGNLKEEPTIIILTYLPIFESYLILRTVKMEKDVFDNYYFNPSFNDMFKKNINHNKECFNFIVSQNIKILDTSFKMLFYMNVLTFDNKRSYFNLFLNINTSTLLCVEPNSIFEDFFKYFMSQTKEELRNKRLGTNFAPKEGYKAGGTKINWHDVLTKELVSANRRLFHLSCSGKIVYMVNKNSYMSPEHLSLFQFAGRVIGKSIREKTPIDVHFTRHFYKFLLNKKCYLSDLESVDIDLYKTLCWIKDNPIENDDKLTFSADYEELEERKIMELKENGRNILVKDSNKEEYISLMCEFKLFNGVEKQMDAFREGFYDLIDFENIKIFDEKELELLICGVPYINIEDWKNNTIYYGYESTSNVIIWFWKCVNCMKSVDRVKLLQFVIGTSKLPLDGFSNLKGSYGTQKFQIHKDSRNIKKLPSAQTYCNQLNLPEYETYEELNEFLMLATTK